MAPAVWKGTIVLSLVSIPVRLYAAARSQRTYLHQIHKECNTRVRHSLFCPHCNRFVDRNEIVKGYEFDEGQDVLVEDKEIKKLAASSSRNLEIVAFTKLKEIDPIFLTRLIFVRRGQREKSLSVADQTARGHWNCWHWHIADASEGLYYFPSTISARAVASYHVFCQRDSAIARVRRF
jgi:Ku protein